MLKHAIPPVLGLLAVLGLFTLEASGQQRIASVQNFMGELQIEHSAQMIKPLKIGKMIRNGDVFDSDTVRTQQGEADLLVVDGSEIRMDQHSTLTIAFEAVQPGAPAPPPAGVDRKVRLIAGRIYCVVQPSRTTTTKFELPDGVAAVRGTNIELVVSANGNWEAGVDKGVMSLTQTTISGQMSLVAGNRLGSARLTGKEADPRLTNLGTGDIDVTLADGSRITGFGPGEIIDVTRLPDGSYSITVVHGSVTFTSASGQVTQLNEGQSLETAAYKPAGGGVVPSVHIGGGSGGGGPTTSNSDGHQRIE